MRTAVLSLSQNRANKPLAMAPCDLLLTHAHLLTLAPVLPDRSDDEGVGYIEDVRAAIHRRPTTRRPRTAARTVAADAPSHCCCQGAVAVTGRTIAAVGTTAELLAEGYGNAVETIDCSGMVVMPGLIVRLKPASSDSYCRPASAPAFSVAGCLVTLLRV